MELFGSYIACAFSLRLPGHEGNPNPSCCNRFGSLWFSSYKQGSASVLTGIRWALCQYNYSSAPILSSWKLESVRSTGGVDKRVRVRAST